jgi:hypothetical protein
MACIGTAYDMKMLKNAMRAEFNEGTLVRLTANVCMLYIYRNSIF